jgi:hypothetical protein
VPCDCVVLPQFHEGLYDSDGSESDKGVIRSAISGHVIKKKVKNLCCRSLDNYSLVPVFAFCCGMV